MKRPSILVSIIVITAATTVHSAYWQLDWVGGDNIPTSWDWSIYPLHFPPFPYPGSIPFSGPTGVFSNDCFALSGLGGTPTITIDPNQRTIELWFQPPAPTVCLMYWAPVCGLNGWFGPLSEGDWLFYSNQIPPPYGPFYINIHIDGTPMLTILNPNGKERLLGGSIYTIRWEDSRSAGCGGSYLLDYSIDNGNNWIPIDSNPVSNTCTYDWLVPSIFSNQCLVRISSYPYIRDTSDDPFSIYCCTSNVLGDWNGDCYVDFGDLSIIAAGWDVPGGTDINDLAVFVQYWLDCANPYDPSCNFGEAMPDFPVDGTVIDGNTVPYDDFVWTMLVFIPGPTAVGHKGYFNEDYSKVASRHPDANLGSPPYAHIPGWEYVFFAGHSEVPPAIDSLVRGQKYYWTVDETDALGNTFAGDIWEFTILDFKATSPNTPNEATLVGTDVLLSWQPGYGVEDHDIYMGTSWEDVNNARFDIFNLPPEFVDTVEEPNIFVTGLLDNTTYYWRVDEVSGRCPVFCFPPDYYKGDVWCFTTAPSALNNDGSINLKDYAIPSNYRQKTGPIPTGYIRKDDVLDYIN
ncbi:MAG: hypothetical protein GWN67_14290 [Phycisphaerae bacterium]|nr:hypothetical protein [Phycisphaerae bacterium]NIP53288.1 hypothetical protein [Phycisphaerae bacterium]NIS52309.1 hypothetical protein [Phycisphaerae bacterium]NIU09850.1 hypothetical protein [Phycisphaerae bacterium]NIU57506.1 hypothetical protein [Phycisphaerae bacterium]